MMVLLVRVLIGLLLVVAAVYSRYLRQETTVRRRRAEPPPGTLRAELNLATGAPLAALSRGALHA
jgi:hypothetical protein